MKNIKSLLKLAALAVCLLPAVQGVLQAGAPLKINFQGRLDESGQPAAGSKTFVFTLYDAASGGNLVWTSQAQALALTQGVFSAVLSAGTPVALSTATFAGARYVEITVDGVSLSPRQEMVSAPYALVAQALAPDAVLPPPAIAAGSVTDTQVAITTAAITSGKFSDDRLYVSTGAFYGGFNAADQLVQLDAAGKAPALSFAGAVSLPVAVAVSDAVDVLVFNLLAAHSTVLVDAALNDVTVVLPTAAGITGRVFTVKRVNDDMVGGTVFVTTTGIETLDGYNKGNTSLPYEIGSQWDFLTMQSDGTNWMIISR